MRKLDELLQDIPLGLLLPDSDVKEEKEEAPRRCIARSSEEAPAALRSGLPVGAAAALIAAAAAIVLAVSVKMNHSVGTEPAGQPEISGPATSAAESVNGAADVISSSEAESTSEQMQKNISAKELHILMKWYMAENPDSGLGSEDVLFVRMNGTYTSSVSTVAFNSPSVTANPALAAGGVYLCFFANSLKASHCATFHLLNTSYAVASEDATMYSVPSSHNP